MTIFALNIMPYISASIIIQLMTTVSDRLAQLKKEGESGRKKINQYTRYGTVLLATIQGYAIAVGLENMSAGSGSAVIDPGAYFRFTAVVTLTGGTIFLMWLGEQINAPGFMTTVTAMLGRGQPLYLALYGLLIVFFCYFYTSVVFNPEDTADNLKKYGGFIPGIRPGKNTANYLDFVLTRLTTVGSIYLVLVALLPEVLISRYGVPFYFGGTSLLIVVTVTLDTVMQIQSHLLAHQYEGLIKKSKLKGNRR
jgi:preprotein translocase subunit SecY